MLFTGLPGAGKTTLARALSAALRARGRTITLLDGDEVRDFFGGELGYSREQRELNLRRVAYVAGEVVRHGGIALCALIAPYAASRRQARELVSKHGGFVEVYLSAPLAVCERRDPKGLYAAARAGTVTGVTGIDDPYEAPATPELRIDTSELSVDAAIVTLTEYLAAQGYIDRG